jgi:hypothetical protein
VGLPSDGLTTRHRPLALDGTAVANARLRLGSEVIASDEKCEARAVERGQQRAVVDHYHETHPQKHARQAAQTKARVGAGTPAKSQPSAAQ